MYRDCDIPPLRPGCGAPFSHVTDLVAARYVESLPGLRAGRQAVLFLLPRIDHSVRCGAVHRCVEPAVAVRPTVVVNDLQSDHSLTTQERERTIDPSRAPLSGVQGNVYLVTVLVVVLDYPSADVTCRVTPVDEVMGSRSDGARASRGGRRVRRDSDSHTDDGRQEREDHVDPNPLIRDHENLGHDMPTFLVDWTSSREGWDSQPESLQAYSLGSITRSRGGSLVRLEKLLSARPERPLLDDAAARVLGQELGLVLGPPGVESRL